MVQIFHPTCVKEKKNNKIYPTIIHGTMREKKVKYIDKMIQKIKTVSTLPYCKYLIKTKKNSVYIYIYDHFRLK